MALRGSGQFTGDAMWIAVGFTEYYLVEEDVRFAERACACPHTFCRMRFRSDTFGTVVRRVRPRLYASHGTITTGGVVAAWVSDVEVGKG